MNSKKETELERLLTRVQTLLGQSDYLRAFDLTRQGVATHPDHIGLRHAGVLAMARMGATERAQALFNDWNLDDIDDDEEVLALWARLLKDRASSTPPAERKEAWASAAGAYERAFAAQGGYFPAINVASLRYLAGDQESAEVWAKKALELARSEDSYFAQATVAEAYVILAAPDKAASALLEACAAPGAGVAAKSTTRRQLTRLIEDRGYDASILDPLIPPKVAHFCGHRPAAAGQNGRFPQSEIDRVASEIRAIVSRERIGYGFGSLAAGADLMIAEAILDQRGELEVVLPFDRDEFLAVSVRPNGAEWVDRFEQVLSRASKVHFVTEDAYLGHDELFNYTSHLAIGHARLHAQRLGAELCQVAVWDGQPPRPQDLAGTAFDIAKGKQIGLQQHIIASRSEAASPEDVAFEPSTGERQRRVMVFGDLKGFSKLSDQQLPIYVETVLGACAEVFDQFDESLMFRNTWGDGLFLVFDDLAAAADCAFTLREKISALPYAEVGLPQSLGLRLGLHYGPVFETRDPVLDRMNYFGFHVSRAARVEPITPEGEVYVTDAAAAALAVDCPDAYRCDYVGEVPLAKGYGAFPMYSLIRILPA